MGQIAAHNTLWSCPLKGRRGIAPYTTGMYTPAIKVIRDMPLNNLEKQRDPFADMTVFPLAYKHLEWQGDAFICSADSQQFHGVTFGVLLSGCDQGPSHP